MRHLLYGPFAYLRHRTRFERAGLSSSHNIKDSKRVHGHGAKGPLCSYRMPLSKYAISFQVLCCVLSHVLVLCHGVLSSWRL